MAIRLADAADAGPVTAMMAAAFAQGPLAEWIEPDPVTRTPLYAAHGALVWADAVNRGWVHTTTDHRGAAVWRAHPGGTAIPPVASDAAGAGPRPAGSGALGRLARLEAVLAALVPPRPHHQLAYLGVHPDHQGQGIGTALLTYHHEEVDAFGTAVFLVATSDRSRDLYLRHGYTVTTVATLPDGPDLWAMWRHPQR